MASTIDSKLIVRAFLQEVRSGRNPKKAAEYMAETVLAHQMNAENPQTIHRTPQNYAEHIEEFLGLYGRFEFEITELIAENDKVYARWKQTGRHLMEFDGFQPTHLPLVEIASAVYRVENGKIVEYWIEIDRKGVEEQLKRNVEIFKK